MDEKCNKHEEKNACNNVVQGENEDNDNNRKKNSKG
jgi:hypothetical protein